MKKILVKTILMKKDMKKDKPSYTYINITKMYLTIEKKLLFDIRKVTIWFLKIINKKVCFKDESLKCWKF